MGSVGDDRYWYTYCAEHHAYRNKYHGEIAELKAQKRKLEGKISELEGKQDDVHQMLRDTRDARLKTEREERMAKRAKK